MTTEVVRRAKFLELTTDGAVGGALTSTITITIRSDKVCTANQLMTPAQFNALWGPDWMGGGSLTVCILKSPPLAGGTGDMQDGALTAVVLEDIWMATGTFTDHSGGPIDLELPLTPGRAAATASRTIALSSEDFTALGSLATKTTLAAVLAKLVASTCHRGDARRSAGQAYRSTRHRGDARRSAGKR